MSIFYFKGEKNIEEKYYKVWITLIKDLGIKKYINLLKRFKTNKNIFNATKNDLIQSNLISEKLIDKILNVDIRNQVQKHLQYMQKNNIDIISISDEEYPSILREIYSPPICLYIRGDKKALCGNNISIIGCRDCSEYGKRIAQKLAYDLSQENINIVSGLAKGIDEYSHLGAVYANGKTIAVLGNGLDVIYPKENKYLVEKILERKGAIISEFPLGTKPEKMNFPLRNRIISGLSTKTVVVEAKKKSGTIITVDFALEQGRDVYVVPGNIDAPNSEGTNDLIKQGAKVITSYKDIIEDT